MPVTGSGSELNARDGFTCRQRVISRYMRYQEPAHSITPSHLTMRMPHAPTRRDLMGHERGTARARYPVRAGGPWLRRTLVLSLFQAAVVPSGLRMRIQPWRWMAIWWWYRQSRTQLARLVRPPLALWRTWWTSQTAAG